MTQTKINSQWKLYYFPQYEREVSLDDIKGKPCIDATVPGNVELDLSRAGILPEDLFVGMNSTLTEQYEHHEWWYETKFTMPETDGKTYLLFEGVDCLAEYWLDGAKVGESDNMLIPYKLYIDSPVAGKEYTLHVRIRSAELEADKYSYDMVNVAHNWHGAINNANFLRKARHSYGWDIMCRIVSAGIWKDVYVVSETPYDFSQLTYWTRSANPTCSTVHFFYETNVTLRGCEIEVSGECGDSHFYRKLPIKSKAQMIGVDIPNAKLWWPKPYGEPNLYKTTVRILKDGKVMAQRELNVGVRTCELKRTDSTNGWSGQFCFYVNNTPIMVYGTNWVPLDAFHSQEKARYPKTLELLDEVGCNMVRWWGGNVYPEKLFYDFCDSHGIMVWQDFAMACASYSQTEEFAKRMEQEVEYVVRAYRDHASLVLWSGDNECDEMCWRHIKGKSNNLTRKTLPEIIRRNDVYRDYLPSSPYIPDGVSINDVPERHLWGPRDYYKSPYYKDSTAHFVSETGYHGCPSKESIKKFITGDVQPREFITNKECILHSSDQAGNGGRMTLIPRQIQQLFGSVPEDYDDYVLASQISQAEADKFLIENFRIQKFNKGGILWWNLIDGWPQFSDAVVDYYYDKKLAYYYIKKSQQPVTVLFGEMWSWTHGVAIVNDTLKSVDVEYKVIDLSTDKVVLSGKATVAPNARQTVGSVGAYYSDKTMFKMEYTVDGGEVQTNHYLAGLPPFSLEQYKAWMKKM